MKHGTEPGSSALRQSAGPDDPIDPFRAQLMSPLVFGFLPDDSQDLWFRGSETHIVPNAEEHSPRAAPLLYDDRPALIFHAAKELAKIRARM
jgi:hypothetical protein